MSRKIYLGAILLIIVAAVTVLLALYITPVRKVLVAMPALRQAYSFLYFRGAPPSDLKWLGDGGQATGILLHDPTGVAEDELGNVFIADRGRWWGLQVIWKIDENGTARVVGGTARRGSVRESVNARQSDLGQPEGLVVDPSGRVYFADAFNHVVLRIEPDGQLSRIAGVGSKGFTGDGSPARKAMLANPFDVDLDSAGNLFIADYGNNRVRMVDKDGTITTVAGIGAVGYSGDDGPATAARLNGPYGITIDLEDRLLIADSHNNVIRRVDRDGTITTIVGTGEAGYGGDGGPAELALLDAPQALFVDQGGRLYVGDEHNHAIRLVTANGIISKVIGDGVAGLSPDGTPSAEAMLADPESLLVRDDGTFLMTEGDNGLVRRISLDDRLETFAGRQP